MTGVGVFLSFFFMILGAYLVFRVIVRQDYARDGRLSWLSVALETLIFAWHANLSYLFLPAPWPAFPPLPLNVLQRFSGFVVIGTGLIITIWAMASLGLRKALGQNVEGLHRSGFYQYSRNPQIVAYGLFLSGFVILWPSVYALSWILVYAIVGHLMVITEEEHLRRVFGQEYEAYCRQVPRYIV